MALGRLSAELRIGLSKLSTLLQDLPPVLEKEETRGTSKYWYIADVIDHIQSDNGVLNLDAERARLAKEQADQTAIRNEILRSEVVPCEKVSEALNRVAASVVNILESIPIRLKRACPSLMQTDLDLVRSEISKARNEMADIYKKIDVEKETVPLEKRKYTKRRPSAAKIVAKE